jgi:hypothetical protein
MVGQDRETGHAAHCTYAAACAMATGRILLLLMTLKLSCGYAKMRITKECVTRVTGIDNKIAGYPVNNHTVYEIYLRN